MLVMARSVAALFPQMGDILDIIWNVPVAIVEQCVYLDLLSRGYELEITNSPAVIQKGLETLANL